MNSQTRNRYAVKKSSVSRQWRTAPSAQLEKPCNGSVPRALLALVIDSKHLLGDCAAVALEGDVEGKKASVGPVAGSERKCQCGERAVARFSQRWAGSG
jgi:hypothetical protein